MEDAAAAAVQFMLEEILSQTKQEINLIQNCKKDLKKLKNSWRMIQSFIASAEEQRDSNPAVKRWLDQLEDVAFEAEVVLDEFNYELLRQKVKNRKGETRKVMGCFSFGSCGLFFRSDIAHKIKDINEKLKSVNNEAESFGLQKEVVDARNRNLVGSIISAAQQTDSFAVESNVVGRENDVSEIVKKLVTAPTEESFSVIPIVGMGGLGKTTLARKIFQDETINTHFGLKIWVCVSIHFDAVILFKMILETLTGENVQVIMTRVALLEKIKEHLVGKKYLLVLDDVWNDELDKWDDFIDSLSGISSVKGNGIIVTTRNENVASIVKTLPTYQLNELSIDDCWSIIKSKASLRVRESTELEEVGKRIAQRCGGLPLAAKVIGGLLRGKSKDYWFSILNNQLSHFGGDENIVQKILKLSYDRLPSSSLKKCFAYCSVFPQDTLLEREQLIELWMAEGFLEAGQGVDMEIVGDVYFDHLLQNSLLQEAETDDYRNISLYKMHDLVHDLASLVSGSRSIIVKDGESKDLNQARYVLLESLEDEPNIIYREQAKYWRTVFFNGGYYTNFMFSDFKSLHVLKLVSRSIAELPGAIEELINLRFLDISETSITSFPDSIGKLYHLQTLRTWVDRVYLPSFEKLPDTIIDLVSLRHLHVACFQLPPGIGKLISLRTLPYYSVGHEDGCRIGEFGELNNLRGDLMIDHLERVNDFEEAKHAKLFGKPNILSLTLRWNSESRESEMNDKDVLEGLQPHPMLKSLEINRYRGKNFRVWTNEKMRAHDDMQGYWIGLNNLMSIRLIDCHGCEEVPMLGHLPCLKSLYIEGLDDVQSIDLPFYGPRGTKNPFAALEQLVLRNMENLREWVDVERGAAECLCLDYMSITECHKLRSISSYFSRVKELHISNVGANFSLSNVFKRVTCLEDLSISEMPGPLNLPERFFFNNQNLTSVRISGCPNFMQHFPSFLGGGACLRKLDINKCEKFIELPVDLSTLRSLQELEIHNCGELKSIPHLKGQLLGLTSLRILTIYNCKKFTELPCEILESCSSLLEKLTLRDLENWVDSTAENPRPL